MSPRPLVEKDRTFYSAGNIELLDNLADVEQVLASTWRHFWDYWREQGSPKFVELPSSRIEYNIDGVYQSWPSEARFIVQAIVVPA